MKKILVTGSRNWKNKEIIRVTFTHHMINWRVNPTPEYILIQGECPYGGADIIARDLFLEWELPVISVPAQWGIHGKYAGPKRNIFMLDTFKPDIVLAFPLDDSKGTRHCILEARKREIPTYVYRTNGILEE